MEMEMEKIDGGPSPLVPSLLVGAIGLIKGWPAFLSFLRFLVTLLEELTMTGEDDSSSSSLFNAILALLVLFMVAASVQLLLELLRHANDTIDRSAVFSRGTESSGFGLGTALLVVIFVVLCNLV